MTQIRSTDGFSKLIRLCPDLVKQQDPDRGFDPVEIHPVLEETVELTAEEQASCDYIVSGAGGKGSSVNGCYKIVGMYNGKPKFKKVDGRAIIFFSRFWKINHCNNTGGWFYSINETAHAEPPVGTWTLHGYNSTDANPPPRVRRPPCADQIGRYCRLLLRALPSVAFVPLPFGGLQSGDPVIYTGKPIVYASGDVLKRCHQGRVVDTNVNTNVGNCKVKFAEHSRTTVMEKDNLCLQPLPGCFAVGDTVQYSGEPKSYVSGDELKAGQLGTVTGPASGFNRQMIEVKFHGHRKKTDVDFTDITKRAKPIALRRKRKNASKNNGSAEVTISTKGRCPHLGQ
jgi:hypothetical protein